MSTDQNTSRLQSLLREPTFHFFIMALVIFAVYGISSSTQENVLELDQREIDARLFMQEIASGQALSEEQREYLTSAFVEEQILVQEALKMGLDNEDYEVMVDAWMNTCGTISLDTCRLEQHQRHLILCLINHLPEITTDQANQILKTCKNEL